MQYKEQILTEELVRQLESGDVIRHRNGSSYVVLRSAKQNGGRAIAVREVVIDRPNEWILVRKHRQPDATAGGQEGSKS
jgi:hypothetical protein